MPELVSKQPRIAVAMSGGVDSSVTAALLKEQGRDVIGITLRLYEKDESAESPAVCGGGAYVEDARRVAERLGIEHHVLDMRQNFLDDVVKPFADSYTRGQTPNPCAICNRKIKFGALLQAAQQLGAKALATGHYARRIDGAHGPELHAAADQARDQSYFLFATPRDALGLLHFPLGELSKTQTRALAERFALPVADKPDSQDICFVPDGDYAAVVNRFHPEAFRAGDIVDDLGRVLGKHEGVINFTVGQRRGLNIGDRKGDNNEPLFVLRLDPQTARVVVGHREALAEKTVFLHEVNWLAEAVPEEGRQVAVRLRSTQAPVAARYTALPNNQGRINLIEPAYGIAPGQAGVVYDGPRVLGGGWIARNPH